MNTSMMDEKKFIQAYEKFADAIFRHCFFRVYDRELAKDLTQDTFKRTWIFITRGNSIKNIRAFLYKVANNVIIDETRRKKELSLEKLQERGFEPKDERDQENESYTKIEAARIIRVIGRLDEKSREVITLRFIDEFQPKEIARIIRESENVVSVRLNRAIKKVRELLKDNR